MLNVLKQLPKTYRWPVKFKAPTDNGSTVEIEFEVEYRRIKQTRLMEIMGIGGDTDSRPQTDSDVIAEVVENVYAKADDGSMQLVPDELLQELFETPGAERAVVLGMFASVSGENAKNSRTPPATGRHK